MTNKKGKSNGKDNGNQQRQQQQQQQQHQRKQKQILRLPAKDDNQKDRMATAKAECERYSTGSLAL
jgi:hypothetical protein